MLALLAPAEYDPALQDVPHARPLDRPPRR